MTAHPDHAGSAHRWRIVAWGSAALLIVAPLLAMQVTDQVDWGVFDFVFAAMLIGGVGAGWELALRMTRNRAWRVAIAMALAAAFLLIWAELAVGIISA